MPEPSKLGAILVIDMGGTIAEDAPAARGRPKRVYRGAASIRFLSAGRAAALARIAECDGVYWGAQGSPDIRIDAWRELAAFIAKHRHAYHGFVVTHGSDTLAWASAVLSFALIELPVTVVLTGAMRPIDRSDSDGWSNLRHAVKVARRAGTIGVSVAFGGRLLHGCRVRKLVSHPFKAFEDPVAIDLSQARANHLSRRKVSNRRRHRNEPPPAVPARLERDVMLLVVTPTLSAATVRQCGRRKGVVIETYPSGTIPEWLHSELAKLARRCVVVVTIENGRRTAPRWADYPGGVISVRDMTREAAIVKLMWALGRTGGKPSAERLMRKNLIGEMSEDQ